MIDWDDTDLIEACLAGDERAWKTLIERYSRLIYSIPLRLGFSETMADEIFQETCVILLHKLDTLRDRDKLSSWLMTVTRHTCTRHWKRENTVQQSDLTEVVIGVKKTPEDALLNLEERHQVQIAFENLSPRCRQLLKALFVEDPPRPYDAVADELDMPVGSIGPTRIRCLQKLRQELTKLERSGATRGTEIT